MKEINLKVEGMMCTGCENRIQNAVKNMNGIKSVKADHTTGTVKIEAEDGIEESKIKEKIENIYAYILENLHEEIAANKLMDKIEDGVLRLAQNPYSCPKVKVKPHNEIYRKLIINNYIVLYDIDEEYKKTVIYRVIHEKTDYLKLLED